MPSIGAALSKISKALKSKGIKKLPSNGNLAVTLTPFQILGMFATFRTANDLASAVDAGAQKLPAGASPDGYARWVDEINKELIKDAPTAVRNSPVFRQYQQAIAS